VQRQTGRHAAPTLTMQSQVRCADGLYLNTGVPPRTPQEYGNLRDWLVELGLAEEFPEIFLLEMGMKRDHIDLSKIAEDKELQAIFGAARQAQNFLASKLPAYDYFEGAQKRGLSLGIIYSPEEVMEDRHFVERGFPVEVEHAELGRSIVYPGAPYRFEKTPWRIQRRAPRLGEHNDQVLDSLV
jgi:crotonobetainyl-CoA:carnitine CoA-transferase CaiB-like acyl-CoA transferase